MIRFCVIVLKTELFSVPGLLLVFSSRFIRILLVVQHHEGGEVRIKKDVVEGAVR